MSSIEASVPKRNSIKEVNELKPFVELTTMKLFQKYEEVVSFLVVRDEAYANKTVNRASHFILNIVPPVVSLSVYIVFASVFLFFEAETFQQYCETFYPWITSILNFLGLASILLKRERFFELIDEYEKTVNARKFILS